MNHLHEDKEKLLPELLAEEKGIIVAAKYTGLVIATINNPKLTNYIVMACNNFEEMLQALKEICAYEERGRDMSEPRIAEKYYNLTKKAIANAEKQIEKQIKIQL